MRNQIERLKPYLILLLVLFVAYLPLSTFHFGMKNDAFSDNFPNKYFLSEALHAGYFPLWNSYINFGFPVYADPGFAYWNPITWIFALIGYNAYTLTAEVLLYLWIAGICMYHLCRYFKFHFVACIVVACMYMCSGFFVGSLQYINFITSAAFLPFLVLCFLKLQFKSTYKSAFLCAIGYYTIFCGGHPAIPIATIYFLLVLFLLLIFSNKELRRNWKQLLLYNSLAVILFILFYLPALYSYLNVFPFYGRNTLPDQVNAFNTGFSFASVISFIFPFATAKSASSFFNNDVAMRNVYFSIAGFLAFIYVVKKRNTTTIIFSITGLLMSVLSIGDGLKMWLFPKLPLLSFVRTNGEFRVFIVLCFCITAGFGLNEIVKQKKLPDFFLKSISFTGGLSFIMIIFLLLRNDFHFSTNKGISLAGNVKFILDHASISFYLFVSCCVTFAVCIFLWMARRKVHFIPIIIIADLIINAIIYLPVTGVGQVTLENIQAVYDMQPEGIPIPTLIPIKSIDTFNTKVTGLLGDKTYYNKQIGTIRLTDYPSYFTSTDHYFNSTIRNSIDKQPYLFLKSQINDIAINNLITVKTFSPSHILIAIKSPHSDTLVYLQNYYKFWKATVNGKKSSISTAYNTFLSVPIAAGINTIEFTYDDPYLLPLIIFSVIVFLISFIVYLKKKETIS